MHKSTLQSEQTALAQSGQYGNRKTFHPVGQKNPTGCFL